MNWWSFLRIALKAAVLLAGINLVFALTTPVETRLTVYNGLVPGRERLPYGENPAESYNLSLFNLPAMVASHKISQPKADDEFRVILLGDSATWGWFLGNDDTLAGQLNAGAYTTDDGRTIRVYNLGYPIMSLTKDLLILQEAMRHDPDLIVWPVTLSSFPREKQLFPPLVQENADRVRELIAEYDLALDADDPRFVERDFWEETLVGRRRALANWVRLQVYGFAWAATGIDQAIPDDIPLRRSDFEDDLSWENYPEPVDLTRDDLAFDVLTAGMAMAGEVPVVLVNEPMFISDGENSDLRYNSFYPRWAYDQYREILAQITEENGWRYVDAWDLLPPDAFTDTPVHTTPAGAAEYAAWLAEITDFDRS
jgi:hypothetical protein